MKEPRPNAISPKNLGVESHKTIDASSKVSVPLPVSDEARTPALRDIQRQQNAIANKFTQLLREAERTKAKLDKKSEQQKADIDQAILKQIQDITKAIENEEVEMHTNP